MAEGNPVIAGTAFGGVGGGKVIAAVFCPDDVGVCAVEDKGVVILGLLHRSGNGIPAGLGQVHLFQIPLHPKLRGGAVGIGGSDGFRHLRRLPQGGVHFRHRLHAGIGGSSQPVYQGGGFLLGQVQHTGRISFGGIGQKIRGIDLHRFCLRFLEHLAEVRRHQGGVGVPAGAGPVDFISVLSSGPDHRMDSFYLHPCFQSKGSAAVVLHQIMGGIKPNLVLFHRTGNRQQIASFRPPGKGSGGKVQAGVSADLAVVVGSHLAEIRVQQAVAGIEGGDFPIGIHRRQMEAALQIRGTGHITGQGTGIAAGGSEGEFLFRPAFSQGEGGGEGHGLGLGRGGV